MHVCVCVCACVCVCVCVRRSRVLSQERIWVEFKQGWRSVKAKLERAGVNLHPQAQQQAAPLLCETDAANSDFTRRHLKEEPFQCHAILIMMLMQRWRCLCRAAAQHNVLNTASPARSENTPATPTFSSQDEGQRGRSGVPS